MEGKQVHDMWQTETVHEGGRYTVPIPWRPGRPSFPNNRFLAMKRLECNGKRLNQRGMSRSYGDGIRKLLEEGHAESVPAECYLCGGLLDVLLRFRQCACARWRMLGLRTRKCVCLRLTEIACGFCGGVTVRWWSVAWRHICLVGCSALVAAHALRRALVDFGASVVVGEAVSRPMCVDELLGNFPVGSGAMRFVWDVRGCCAWERWISSLYVREWWDCGHWRSPLGWRGGRG